MKVVVIGAGATGLAASYLLARAGVKVTVVEAADRPGGLLATFNAGDGHRLEHYYHHFFTHDAEINWLLGQLGLSDRVIFRKTSMGMFRGGRLYPFNGPKDLLGFDAVGLTARLRFGLSSALLACRKAYSRNERLSCLQWFDHWAGPEATDAIWRPLLRVKFGEAAERIPLAWMAGRLRQRALSRKRGEETLGYLDGSLQVLVDRLVEELVARGVEIRAGTHIEGLILEQAAVAGVRTPAGEIRGDRVISTIPTPVLSRLVEPINPGYAARLSAIEYLGAVCTVLSLKQPLSSIYWTNVADPGYSFGGVIEHTNFVPAERYGGRHLVYLSRYLSVADPLWAMDDAALLQLQLDELSRMFGRRIERTLQRHWVFRGRFAATLTDLGFHRRIPRFRSPVENLYVASMCHIYPDERSVNNSIRVAAELVHAMGLAEGAMSVPCGISLAARYGA
ncbi:MAG: NAD(P)/FAD-dependent oxidoreductase [Pirellulales bacterium]|nr:NAD(P)/FAD-dependent oxidoreductase [Pirellulales bacterium]